MKEINELTKHLLSIGYTKENPPEDYHRWDDFYGGWTYSHKQERNMVLKAPCGVVSLASNAITNCYWLGVDWCLENDKALIRCPFRKLGCEKNNSLLRDIPVIDGKPFCEAKIVERAFDYELSAEQIEERERQDYEKAILDFSKTQERFCRKHVCYDKYTNKFWIKYEPWECSGKCSYCTMLKQKLGKPYGNVFYDLKISREIEGFGFIPNEWQTHIIKGLRLFEKNKPLALCEVCALPEYRNGIERKVKNKYFTEIHFAKYHGKGFKYEILNVRAEKRESRDLEQDLRDISNGITVSHHSDIIAAEVQSKRDRKQKSKEQKKKRLLRLCSENGYNALPDIEKIRIQKAIKQGLITEQEIFYYPKVKSSFEQLTFLEKE